MGFSVRAQAAINFARRTHARYDLNVPVDLETLARKHADLKFRNIPFDIDGVSVNLKKKGKRPTIIVNKTRPQSRQRFTLAHEIGHVIIPWHMGTIFDITEPHLSEGAVDYWEMESEANTFATELLMPQDWVSSFVNESIDVAQVHRAVREGADVSFIAAALRLRSLLPPGYAFAAYNSENRVTYSGKSVNTHFSPPVRGEIVDNGSFSSQAEELFEIDTGWDRYIWAKFPTKVALPSDTRRPWRDTLNEIIRDTAGTEEQKKKYLQRLNGVLGFANGVARQNDFSEEELCSVCMQRLGTNLHLKPLVAHQLFPEFLSAKIRELIQKNER